ncbi:MAG TPA: TonB-dependent receptor plug domain-containing protein, partial [Rhodothermia bacterium]
MTALALSSSLNAQDLGAIEGRVTGVDGPLPGVQVHLIGAGFGAVTDENGEYRFEAPPGLYTIEARFVGFETRSREIAVERRSTVRVDLVLDFATVYLDDAIVTATGERQSRSDIAASIGAIDRNVIDRTKPGHPSELMQRISGVWVSNTSGEGHMTSIRQPLTLEPVYLFLEDGIPTRSTGFFNHNSLNEINIPQADAVEVLKGPGTALYGSDAIGGVINVTTRPTPTSTVLGISGEGGSYGFARLLASVGTGFDNGGIAADVNVTRSDGWRDATDYNRQSGTLRWDQRLPNNQKLKS